MSDRSQVLGIVLWFYRLSPVEIAASEAGHFSGYLAVPEPSRGLLAPYYFVCCQLDRKPCVMILPRIRTTQTIICSVPEPGAFHPIIQTAVEAGVAIQQTNAQVCLFSGSVKSKSAEALAALLSRKASLLCATHRGMIHDVQ